MGIFKAIFKCKMCNEIILNDDTTYKKVNEGIKNLSNATMTHTCEVNSESNKIGILEHIGFWEKKIN